MKKHQLQSIFFTVGLVTIVGLMFVGLTHAYVMTDWLKLRNYTPPAAIVRLADQTTLTGEARHMLYINDPAVEDKAIFNGNCDKFGEQTIVLGCYQGLQKGIHVLAVDDERLQGVEQVTLAHETLHAIYDRLGGQEKNKVNTMLEDYAATQLSDNRIKVVLKGYEKTEPGQQLNEMHSIFGTEIEKLPGPLEQYYSQYFSNRKAITTYASQYQAAFTSRQAAIKQYDAQLRSLVATIKAGTAQLTTQQSMIEADGRELERYRSNGNIERYNQGVGPYNQSINVYNALLTVTKQQIETYNQIVTKRNVIATQAQELQQAIDSSSLPDSK